MASRIQTEHIVVDSELKLANNQLARMTHKLCLALESQPKPESRRKGTGTRL